MSSNTYSCCLISWSIPLLCEWSYGCKSALQFFLILVLNAELLFHFTLKVDHSSPFEFFKMPLISYNSIMNIVCLIWLAVVLKSIILCLSTEHQSLIHSNFSLFLGFS